MNRKSVILATALVACTAMVPASAATESLPERAVNALGAVIANQGNLALLEIRRELKETLLQQFKPLLPKPSETAPTAPAKTPAGR
jgi:hypothetical protein